MSTKLFLEDSAKKSLAFKIKTYFNEQIDIGRYRLIEHEGWAQFMITCGGGFAFAGGKDYKKIIEEIKLYFKTHSCKIDREFYDHSHETSGISFSEDLEKRIW